MKIFLKKEPLIILAKCERTNKVFGIRAEPSERHWNFTWAFPISEKNGKNEKFDRNEISGVINISSTYPNCPYCGATGFYRCNQCGKIVCWDPNVSKVTCPWCGNSSEVQIATEFDSINGSDY